MVQHDDLFDSGADDDAVCYVLCDIALYMLYKRKYTNISIGYFAVRRGSSGLWGMVAVL